MRALSLWQPWADLVVRGVKGIENRPWSTKHRGPLLIHASKAYRRDEAWEAKAKRLGVELPDPQGLPRGGIVGVVDLAEVVVQPCDPWFIGPYGFVLKNARPLPFTPYRGSQRFFDVPADVVARLGLKGGGEHG